MKNLQGSSNPNWKGGKSYNNKHKFGADYE